MNEFRSQILGNAEKKPLLGTKQRRDRGGGGDLTAVKVTRQEARTTDTRGDDRHRLSGQTVAAILRGKRREVELINLSGGGAMIAGKLAAQLWERIDLDFGETGCIEAVVRWVKDGRIGLEFAHETKIDCSPDERIALLRDVIERSFPELGVTLHEPEGRIEEAVETPDPESRRAEQRHPLIWSGTVRFKNNEAPVRLRNISSRGALIQSDITIFADSTLQLDLGEAGAIAATVSWAVGDQAGLVFAEEFDLRKLSASRPQVAPVEWDAPTYLKNAAKDSPWEKGWGRASMEELATSLEGFLKR